MQYLFFTGIASAAFFLPTDGYWKGYVLLFSLISFAVFLFRKDSQCRGSDSVWRSGSERQHDELLHALLENSYHGLAEIRDGIIVDVDRNFASLFEFKPRELIGKSISGLISRERAQDDKSPIFETIGKTANNEILYLEILQSPASATNAWSQIIAVRDITERKKVEEELKQLALYDTVTNLYNRTHLCKHITSCMVSPLENMHTSLLFLDLDNFKSVNDRYGHEKGDEILRAVGKRLEAALRTEDIVARYGGDEFVIVCDDPFDDICNIAQRVLSALRDPFSLDGIFIHLSASIGIVRDILDYSDVDSALRAADKAMYCAKAKGKDQFSFAFLERPEFDGSQDCSMVHD